MDNQIREPAPSTWLKAACVAATITMATLLAGASYPGDINGTVRARSGEPLKGVYVHAAGRVTKTDDKGHYTLKEPGRVILFTLYNYRPLTKVLDPGMTTVDVVLEDSTPTEWVAPSCPRRTGVEQRVGSEIQFVKPDGAVIKKITDADYTEHIIGYGPKHTRQWLCIWSGPTVSEGSPPELLVAQSVEVIERAFKCGTHSGGQGVDIGGRLNDGKKWRWVRYPPDMIASYENGSEESARFFDRIIDGSCCATDR